MSSKLTPKFGSGPGNTNNSGFSENNHIWNQRGGIKVPVWLNTQYTMQNIQYTTYNKYTTYNTQNTIVPDSDLLHAYR